MIADYSQRSSNSQVSPFFSSSGFGHVSKPLLLTAVVNGSEPPQDARARIRNIRSADPEVDIVRFIPHDWESSEPYVNVRTHLSFFDFLRGFNFSFWNSRSSLGQEYFFCAPHVSFCQSLFCPDGRAMSAFSGFRTVVCVWGVCLNLLGSSDPAGQMPLPCLVLNSIGDRIPG